MITQMICLQLMVSFFFIKCILLDSVFFSLKLLVLLDSETVLLYLYDTKLIPYDQDPIS